MIIMPTDDTKTRIMKSTILLFNEFGPMAPMSKISERAGVAGGTPYKYFKTKEMLLLETYYYARNSIEKINRNDPLAQTSAEGIIKVIILDILRWSALYSDEHQYVEKYEDSVCYNYFSEEFSKLYVGVIRELHLWERIRNDVREDIPEVVISRIISVHCSVFSRYMSNFTMDLDAPETKALMEASADSIWNSIKK
ncbi:TetR/AcrR family transcriptional regulator [Sediminispirochaeta smaragdinae]|uniref:Transcriptional regulator, TetR family n=1 Tax=Sediminispirochaeta smaragdinae (strain DSM 11293 / JCM 15392 / SEBR 4228) TaxID=573413 RepID=E1R2S9_SEDSS|nr:TetR/AcrR family transcriptional regulator [Sediminispirochaeta smaragdinae]ADK80361.1 transcriptional regulator, TetR family [Sediminispirochaeta smaragdinae DSM 11293]